MQLRKLFKLLTSAVLLTLTTVAQENGNWRAASKTAQSITGDIGITTEKIFINFTRFTISRIRALEPAEVAATFDTDSSTARTGSLYRLSIPAGQRFLNKNSLCGSEQTQWMAAYAEGRTLRVAFFSGPKPPVFTLEAISNSSDLCGTFTYVK